MTNLAFQSATTLAGLIRRREISSVALLEHFIERVESLGRDVNAVVVKRYETARQEARAADIALALGEDLGPLHGVPMTIKESFHLTGTPTTYGFEAFRDNIATGNALAVDRLRGAGAVIFGKTNVPPALADGQSNNPVYGRTNNPWDLSRSPGGSSGGSAAALAAGLTALELGSDIASSIRNPAHYCGVFGHKPTHGLCPATGHMLTEMHRPVDIAVIGPLARSVPDLELALSLLSPPAEPYARTLPPAGKTELSAFKVALVVDDDFAEVDEGVRAPLRALGDFLRDAGATVDERARPAIDSAELFRVFMTLMRSAKTENASDEEYQAAVAQAAVGAPDDPATLGAAGLALSHRDWCRLDEMRHRYRTEWRRFLGEYDLLLCPVLSTAAFTHDDTPAAERRITVNGREQEFERQLFWAGYSGVAYLPATVAPIGLTPQGLPVGVQIVGPQYGDLTCLRFAHLLERHYRAFVPPPGFGGE